MTDATDLVTPADVMAELIRLSGLLDDALNYAKDTAHNHAASDDDYRVAHAKAFVTAKHDGDTDGTAKKKADIATEGTRRAARYWEDMMRVAIEAVRSRRTQISALQTAGNALRAELEMARTGPQITP